MKKLLLTSLTTLVFACSTPVMANAAEINSPQGIERVDAQVNPINLNTATAEDLMQLPGVGKSKANAIIAYRESVGRFVEVAQLTEVKGIGEKMLARISSRVKVE